MILISYGTRPEWIKIQPILKNLQSGYQLLFTGQHTDLIPDAEYDWELPFENVSESRLDDIVINVLTWLDQAFHIVGEIDYVMVHGDTTSAMAVAMAAFHREIPVIHLEAGLRTYDLKNPYPEEFNRIMIDKIAEIYFCPTMMNADNIFAERNGNSEFELFVTGNTVIDALLEFAPETT